MSPFRPNAAVRSLLVIAATLPACGDDSAAGTGGSTSSSSTGASSTGPTTSAQSGSSSGTSVGGTTSGTGGEGGSSTGSGDGGSTTGSGGEGGSHPAFADDCETSEDCDAGECVEVNGFRTCRTRVEEATDCTDPDVDACCDSSECDEGEICTVMPDVVCSGPPPLLANACVSTDDQCLSLDCGKNDDACIPAGVFGLRAPRCLYRACSGDDDCTDGPGGSCVPAVEPCCQGVTGYFCAYADGGCRTSSDCAPGEYCQPDTATGVASCVEGEIECPL